MERCEKCGEKEGFYHQCEPKNEDGDLLDCPSIQSAGSLTIVGDHEELLRRFCHYRDALDYCLATLKHHHMTKRGISTLVAKTEKIKDRANATGEPSRKKA